MQYHDHRQTTRRHISRLLQDQLLMRQIERRGGLVEQQAALPCRIPDLTQYPRKVHALTLTTRQRQITARCQMTDISGMHSLHNNRIILLLAAGMWQAAHSYDFGDTKGECQ